MQINIQIIVVLTMIPHNKFSSKKESLEVNKIDDMMEENPLRNPDSTQDLTKSIELPISKKGKMPNTGDIQTLCRMGRRTSDIATSWRDKVELIKTRRATVTSFDGISSTGQHRQPENTHLVSTSTEPHLDETDQYSAMIVDEGANRIEPNKERDPANQ